MDISIKTMTIDYANQVIEWKYDDKYSIYNHDKSFLSECNDGMHFAFIDEKNNLLGYMCFGIEAQIPTDEINVYHDDYLDIGLHINPNLIGKGHGKIFLNLCTKFANTHFGKFKLSATIAKFNDRAQTLFINAGFYKARTIHHKISKKEFVILLNTQTTTLQ